jgi:hypothetical protein
LLEAETGLVKLQDVSKVAAMIVEHNNFFIKKIFWLMNKVEIKLKLRKLKKFF